MTRLGVRHGRDGRAQPGAPAARAGPADRLHDPAGLGLAEDLTKGLIDRFRSLPTARASVLAGRTLSDVVTNAISIAVLVATGFAVGFRFDAGVGEILAGAGLPLLFGFAFSWIFALIGMSVSSPEAANGIGFTAIFPITFISSAFVPVESMPSWLEGFAEVNPITVVVDAMRALWLDAPAGTASGARWPGRPG